MTLTIPKKVLHKILMYASLYGPSSSEPAKHSLIGAVTIHISTKKVQAFTKNHPVMSSMAHIVIRDDGIKGKGSICIGEICKIIGGRDENGNTWKSVFERLDDPITLDVNKNMVILNKDKNYELSISLLKSKLAENTNVEPKAFIKRITQDNDEYILKDDKRVGSVIRIMGRDLKSIVADEKGMPSDYFEFTVTDDDQDSLVIKLGNDSRHSKRKVDLQHVDLDMGDINAKFFNGVEAFASAVIEDEMMDIYYENQAKRFTLFQMSGSEQLLYLEGGALIEE